MYLSIFLLPIIKESTEKLKGFLEERVDLNSQPQDSREQISIMNSCTLLHILLLILGDIT